jgi:branched-chain amino acid transport system substrate-binding protein
MHLRYRRLSPAGFVALLALGLVLAGGRTSFAATYDVGATDKEIKIGNTMPYSGPLSAYATIGRAISAYFHKVNDEGGINGRKVNFLSYDDGFSPPKTVEQVRRLVEQDEVLFLFQTLGTPTSLSVRKYLNLKKIPQLFVATGATVFADPENYPYTMGWQPNYQTEARIYAKYIVATRPGAKIAMLYQNDDAGRDYLKGFKDGLGAHVNLIVKEQTYEVTDPTVDQQIITLRNSGADVLFLETAPKQSTQSIKKLAEIGWKPALLFLANISSSIKAVIEPAGTENSKGIISSAYLKDPDDPQFVNDPAVKDWRAWMKKYYPAGSELDSGNFYAYSVAQTVVQVLKQCGDDLTRENVRKQAANLKQFEVPMLLTGIKIETGPSDYSPIEQMQLMRFDGKGWARFGNVLSSR